MKKKLLLVTNGFPFGNSERGFLSTEYAELREKFDMYIAARIPTPDAGELEAGCVSVGIEPSHVICTGGKKLSAWRTLAQILRPSVMREIWRCRCGGALFLKRVSAVLRYSARADEFEWDIRDFAKERGLTGDNGVDIIYTYWCTQSTLAAARLKAKTPSLRVVTRFLGYDLYNERTEEGWQPFRYDIGQICDRLVFEDNIGKEYFLTHWRKTPGERCVASFLGCPEMRRVLPSPLPSDRLTVVSCSNMIPLKRVELIIDALSELPADVKVSWYHIGDGTSRDELERRAEEKLGKKENVERRFCGYVMNSEINGIYEELRPELFVTASSTEAGCPVSILEAFAMGIPAIATAVGGISEVVITGKTGYLLPADVTAGEIAASITDFFRMPAEKRRELADGAYAFWKERCDAAENARGFVSMLCEL